MNDNKLVTTGQIAYRATMKDGFTELLVGSLFVMFTVMSVQIYFVGIFVVFYIILLPQLTEKFRMKYTYPRVGYVKTRLLQRVNFGARHQYGFLLIGIALSPILMMLMAQDVMNYYSWFYILPFILGMIMFGPSMYLAERTGSKIYWGLGILATIFGLVVSYLTTMYPPTGPFDGLFAYSMLLGIGLLIGGFSKFVYFIHTNPVLDISEDSTNER